MAGSPLTIAQTMLGKREVPDRAAIQDYLKTGGANLDPATTAWCAAFVNSTLGQAGFKGTGSNMARSFLNYGTAVDKPQAGDLAVFSRGDPKGPYGHVGFFQGYGPDGKLQVLGGNQGNAVSVRDFDTTGLLGFRRPGGTVAPPTAGSAMMNPSPIAQQMAPSGPAPTVLGDLVGQTAVQTTAVPPMKNFGDVAAAMMQGQQQRQAVQAEQEAADQTRKAALFGDSLFGPFG